MKKSFAFLLLVSMLLMSSFTYAQNAFSDVDANHWAVNYVYGMYQLKVINGYADGTFKPNNKLKTGEFIKMLSMAMWPTYEYSKPEEGVHWAMPYVKTLDRIILVADNYNAEKLESIITREEAAKLICLFHVNYFAENKEKVLTRDEKYIKSMKDEAQITNKDSRMYIDNCMKFGLINGFDDGTFKPQDGLSRAQAAKVLYTAMFNQ